MVSIVYVLMCDAFLAAVTSTSTGAACEKSTNILHQTQFAKMTNKIKQALISDNVDVALLIEQLCTMPFVKNKKVPLFDEDVFEKIKSIDALWKELRGFWDYELLQCVVEILYLIVKKLRISLANSCQQLILRQLKM